MKNIRVFVPENFQFLEVKFFIYLNRRVFVMRCGYPFELHQLVDAIQMGTHNICFYKHVEVIQMSTHNLCFY